VGTMAGLGGCGKFCFPTGSDPRTVEPVTSRCTAYYIPAHTVFKYESQLLGAIAKLRKATISFVIYVYPSVRPHGTTRLTLDGFS
jgi:hypothetical protein